MSWLWLCLLLAAARALGRTVTFQSTTISFETTENQVIEHKGIIRFGFRFDIPEQGVISTLSLHTNYSSDVGLLDPSRTELSNCIVCSKNTESHFPFENCLFETHEVIESSSILLGSNKISFPLQTTVYADEDTLTLQCDSTTSYDVWASSQAILTNYLHYSEVSLLINNETLAELYAYSYSSIPSNPSRVSIYSEIPDTDEDDFSSNISLRIHVTLNNSHFTELIFGSTFPKTGTSPMFELFPYKLRDPASAIPVLRCAPKWTDLLYELSIVEFPPPGPDTSISGFKLQYISGSLPSPNFAETLEMECSSGTFSGEPTPSHQVMIAPRSGLSTFASFLIQTTVDSDDEIMHMSSVVSFDYPVDGVFINYSFPHFIPSPQVMRSEGIPNSTLPPVRPLSLAASPEMVSERRLLIPYLLRDHFTLRVKNRVAIELTNFYRLSEGLRHRMGFYSQAYLDNPIDSNLSSVRFGTLFLFDNIVSRNDWTVDETLIADLPQGYKVPARLVYREGKLYTILDDGYKFPPIAPKKILVKDMSSFLFPDFGAKTDEWYMFQILFVPDESVEIVPTDVFSLAGGALLPPLSIVGGNFAYHDLVDKPKSFAVGNSIFTTNFVFSGTFIDGDFLDDRTYGFVSSPSARSVRNIFTPLSSEAESSSISLKLTPKSVTAAPRKYKFDYHATLTIPGIRCMMDGMGLDIALVPLTLFFVPQQIHAKLTQHFPDGHSTEPVDIPLTMSFPPKVNFQRFDVLSVSFNTSIESEGCHIGYPLPESPTSTFTLEMMVDMNMWNEFQSTIFISQTYNSARFLNYFGYSQFLARPLLITTPDPVQDAKNRLEVLFDTNSSNTETPFAFFLDSAVELLDRGSFYIHLYELGLVRNSAEVECIVADGALFDSDETVAQNIQRLKTAENLENVTQSENITVSQDMLNLARSDEFLYIIRDSGSWNTKNAVKGIVLLCSGFQTVNEVRMVQGTFLVKIDGVPFVPVDFFGELTELNVARPLILPNDPTFPISVVEFTVFTRDPSGVNPVSTSGSSLSPSSNSYQLETQVYTLHALAPYTLRIKITDFWNSFSISSADAGPLQLSSLKVNLLLSSLRMYNKVVNPQMTLEIVSLDESQRDVFDLTEDMLETSTLSSTKFRYNSINRPISNTDTVYIVIRNIVFWSDELPVFPARPGQERPAPYLLQLEAYTADNLDGGFTLTFANFKGTMETRVVSHEAFNTEMNFVSILPSVPPLRIANAMTSLEVLVPLPFGDVPVGLALLIPLPDGCFSEPTLALQPDMNLPLDVQVMLSLRPHNLKQVMPFGRQARENIEYLSYTNYIETKFMLLREGDSAHIDPEVFRHTKTYLRVYFTKHGLIDDPSSDTFRNSLPEWARVMLYPAGPASVSTYLRLTIIGSPGAKYRPGPLGPVLWQVDSGSLFSPAIDPITNDLPFRTMIAVNGLSLPPILPPSFDLSIKFVPPFISTPSVLIVDISNIVVLFDNFDTFEIPLPKPYIDALEMSAGELLQTTLQCILHIPHGMGLHGPDFVVDGNLVERDTSGTLRKIFIFTIHDPAFAVFLGGTPSNHTETGGIFKGGPATISCPGFSLSHPITPMATDGVLFRAHPESIISETYIKDLRSPGAPIMVAGGPSMLGGVYALSLVHSKISFSKPHAERTSKLVAEVLGDLFIKVHIHSIASDIDLSNFSLNIALPAGVRASTPSLSYSHCSYVMQSNPIATNPEQVQIFFPSSIDPETLDKARVSTQGTDPLYKKHSLKITFHDKKAITFSRDMLSSFAIRCSGFGPADHAITKIGVFGDSHEAALGIQDGSTTLTQTVVTLDPTTFEASAVLSYNTATERLILNVPSLPIRSALVQVRFGFPSHLLGPPSTDYWRLRVMLTKSSGKVLETSSVDTDPPFSAPIELDDGATTLSIYSTHFIVTEEYWGSATTISLMQPLSTNDAYPAGFLETSEGPPLLSPMYPFEVYTATYSIVNPEPEWHLVAYNRNLFFEGISVASSYSDELIFVEASKFGATVFWVPDQPILNGGRLSFTVPPQISINDITLVQCTIKLSTEQDFQENVQIVSFEPVSPETNGLANSQQGRSIFHAEFSSTLSQKFVIGQVNTVMVTCTGAVVSAIEFASESNYYSELFERVVVDGNEDDEDSNGNGNDTAAFTPIIGTGTITTRLQAARAPSLAVAPIFVQDTSNAADISSLTIFVRDLHENLGAEDVLEISFPASHQYLVFKDNTSKISNPFQTTTRKIPATTCTISKIVMSYSSIGTLIELEETVPAEYYLLSLSSSSLIRDTAFHSESSVSTTKMNHVMSLRFTPFSPADIFQKGQSIRWTCDNIGYPSAESIELSTSTISVYKSTKREVELANKTFEVDTLLTRVGFNDNIPLPTLGPQRIWSSRYHTGTKILGDVTDIAIELLLSRSISVRKEDPNLALDVELPKGWSLSTTTKCSLSIGSPYKENANIGGKLVTRRAIDLYNDGLIREIEDVQDAFVFFFSSPTHTLTEIEPLFLFCSEITLPQSMDTAVIGHSVPVDDESIMVTSFVQIRFTSGIDVSLVAKENAFDDQSQQVITRSYDIIVPIFYPTSNTDNPVILMHNSFISSKIFTEQEVEQWRQLLAEKMSLRDAPYSMRLRSISATPTNVLNPRTKEQLSAFTIKAELLIYPPQPWINILDIFNPLSQAYPDSDLSKSLQSTYHLGEYSFSSEMSVTPSSCFNHQPDFDETDIDCGGPNCPLCHVGFTCLVNTDCLSGVCSSFVCLDRSNAYSFALSNSFFIIFLAIVVQLGIFPFF